MRNNTCAALLGVRQHLIECEATVATGNAVGIEVELKRIEANHPGITQTLGDLRT